ncbi:VOC family protein [Caulobacter sp. 17J65-9]|uniref:VOC family protein n=1 Tax=Caulobacter sp. 17J65-9 TaxID=2709382 RepID=UPI0013CB347D|nr:VOC family protein [Caulobacter sp. 17J65-9]NEX91368.1 glyoxalase [Caulobacter sp. 17J65-9]
MAAAHKVEMKLEVLVIPVSDVDRAAQFYESLGWRKDADFRAEDRRLLQFTPPGSPGSIIFGTRASPAPPGSAQFNHLVVENVEAARAELAARGIKVSEVFHDAGGGYNPFDPAARASGPDPQRRSYLSFVSFKDPDGNVWLLQEVTSRLPGRIEAEATSFADASDLAAAMKRAETAHGAHEKRLGHRDEDWPSWYAAYMAAEQHGAAPPV